MFKFVKKLLNYLKELFRSFLEKYKIEVIIEPLTDLESSGGIEITQKQPQGTHSGCGVNIGEIEDTGGGGSGLYIPTPFIDNDSPMVSSTRANCNCDIAMEISQLRSECQLLKLTLKELKDSFQIDNDKLYQCLQMLLSGSILVESLSRENKDLREENQLYLTEIREQRNHINNNNVDSAVFKVENERLLLEIAILKSQLKKFHITIPGHHHSSPIYTPQPTTSHSQIQYPIPNSYSNFQPCNFSPSSSTSSFSSTNIEEMDDLLKSQFQLNNKWNSPEYYRDKTIEEYTNDLIRFVREFSFLYSERAIDFFIRDIWNQLIPVEWRSSLMELDEQEQYQFHHCPFTRESWPKSLKDFIDISKRLSMPNSEPKHKEWKLTSTDVKEFKDMSSLFRGMSSKKIHEILRFSEFINECNSGSLISNPPRRLVDIGSGEGYLTLVLSHHFNYQISGIDYSNHCLQQAQNRQSYIEKQRIVNKLHQSNTTIKKPQSYLNDNIGDDMDLKTKFINEKVQIQNEYARDFDIESSPMYIVNLNDQTDIINELESQMKSKKECENYQLIGLHTCGLLPKYMIENFVKNSRIGSLIDVSCCYYKIENQEQHQFLSNVMKVDNSDFVLSKAALKLSCEAPDQDIDSFRFNIKSYYFRAILEKCLRDENIGDDISIRGISRKHYESFSTYLDQCLIRIKKQQPHIQISNSFQNSANTQYNNVQKLGFSSKVSIFLMLRSCLAPLLESLILVDRYLYLSQYTPSIQSYIIPLFNPSVSPRNLVLVSYKTQNN
ncbi:hypothetical protein DLAC_09107 [Tieghemostelium lacteum]|uniref:Methyltransferase domain-containing protein n=1 Tax=Tieghemostelium lacteum TaxID=361077 RepID=A0A151Z961_TIELA|nr:hypothetical protein DLAC_09107 [Tieghemostelium lacteum]|eukprot:KYQ90482.1 hypothetical protein DLAC_09107 [Tieghemostelium lacteum]